MRLMKVVALVVMVALVFCMGAEPAAKPAPIKALLITGDDVAAHPWREISETTREILVNSGKFDVKVGEDPLILESATALKAYDVIVFTIYAGRSSDLSDQAQENLLNFVKGGKGFFVQHLASARSPSGRSSASSAAASGSWAPPATARGPSSRPRSSTRSTRSPPA